MKKYILVLCTLVILTSCGTGEKPTKATHFRIIKNKSSHLVDLTILGSKQYQLRLDQGDSAVFEGLVTSGGAGATYSDVGWSNLQTVSGTIIFDNERELVYEDGNCENGRNPLNPNIWQLHSCGYYNKDSKYIYEITDADYEMAVPIED